MTKLHLFTDDHDTVIAADMDDAAKVWEETIGSTYEEEVGDGFTENWRQVDPHTVITIVDDEGSGRQTKNAKDWAASHGRGFLCSTDY